MLIVIISYCLIFIFILILSETRFIMLLNSVVIGEYEYFNTKYKIYRTNQKLASCYYTGIFKPKIIISRGMLITLKNNKDLIGSVLKHEEIHLNRKHNLVNLGALMIFILMLIFSHYLAANMFELAINYLISIYAFMLLRIGVNYRQEMIADLHSYLIYKENLVYALLLISNKEIKISFTHPPKIYRAKAYKFYEKDYTGQ